TTSAISAEYLALASDPNQKAVVAANVGRPVDPAQPKGDKLDARKIVPGAAKIVKADYFCSHITHAPMEPQNAIAKVDGDKIDVWVGTQSPTVALVTLSRLLKTPLENITIHKQLAGGGFGGRYESYEIVQAVLLAKAMPGRPIKLIWSREDDILNDC